MRIAALAVLASVAFAAPALAQQYPSRTITIINPFSAGGAPDLLARGLAEGMGPILGQQLIVQNREGGGGVIGATAITGAAPDGYTLGFSAAGTLTTRPLLVKDLPYGPESFEAICQTFELHITLAVHKDSPFKTFADFMAAAKANPEGVSVGHTGVGSPPHLALAHLESISGIKLNHIAYRGDGQLLQNLAGNHVQVAASGMGAVTGREDMRMLVMFGDKRDPGNPNVPTVIESGFPVERVAAGGLYAVKGLPADIKKKLSDACVAAIKTPAYLTVAEKLKQPVAYLDGPAWDRRLAAETKVNRELIAKLGLKPE